MTRVRWNGMEVIAALSTQVKKGTLQRSRRSQNSTRTRSSHAGAYLDVHAA